MFIKKYKIGVAYAHCDLPCGVYNPMQARIEAESIKAIIDKYNANKDETFRARCVVIKEERARLVKEHLSILWSDFFKDEHFNKYPHLHKLFNDTLKLVTLVKNSFDVNNSTKLLDSIDQIADIFWEVKRSM